MNKNSIIIKKENRYNLSFDKFRKDKKTAFVPFWVLNYPTKEKSLEIIKKIGKNADILELGIPFSDPVADGPVIQEADNIALKNGSTTKKAFEVISEIRKFFPDKPIGLLVYFNLILGFGIEKFFKACQKNGVDSILIPEIPVEELNRKIENKTIKDMSKKYNINLVFLISTNTPQDRRLKIYKESNTFIYVVSTPGITGVKKDLKSDTKKMIKNLKKETKIPICIGFGVSSPEHVKNLKKEGADGVIIGSKLFEIYKKNGIDKLEKFCEDCISNT